MWLTSLLDGWTASSRNSRKKSRRGRVAQHPSARRRLQFEQLETRQLLSILPVGNTEPGFASVSSTGGSTETAWLDTIPSLPDTTEIHFLNSAEKAAVAGNPWATSNVKASVHGGNLLVRGDNRGANITISQPGLGKITITGNETNVNGSAEPVTFSGVTGDLRINLGEGDDWLTFDETNPIVLSGNLSIKGGGGSNIVDTLPGSPGSLNVGGSLMVLNLDNANLSGVPKLKHFRVGQVQTGPPWPMTIPL